MEEGAARGRSVSRLNVLIAITAAIIGLIYGFDLGSIASAFLFLIPAFDLSTFMTSVVTSAVVLGQLFRRSLCWAHLQQRRPLARGDPHVSLPKDRDQTLHLARSRSSRT